MADAKHPHVVLVGLSGTGKTSIGRIVAQRLAMPFLDADDAIEAREGRSVREVFAQDGEARFREIEADVMGASLAATVPTVTAAGGGAVVSAATRERLQRDDVFCVWLTAQPAFLASRAAGKAHRPLLDDDPVGALTRLAEERQPWFDAVADAVVDVQPALANEPKPQAKSRLADRIVALVGLRLARRTRDHVVFVGAMGSGKTTIGTIVAERLGRRYVDSDAELERRSGRSARRIAEADGLAALHALELQVLLDAVAMDEPAVIGSAASVVDDRTGRLALGTARRVVWLRINDHDRVARAARSDARPAVDPDAARRRAPLYASVATIVVDIDDLTPEEAADIVLADKVSA
jgi:shikimate kinase